MLSSAYLMRLETSFKNVSVRSANELNVSKTTGKTLFLLMETRRTELILMFLCLKTRQVVLTNFPQQALRPLQ